jgi:hypothetical protein
MYCVPVGIAKFRHFVKNGMEVHFCSQEQRARVFFSYSCTPILMFIKKSFILKYLHIPCADVGTRWKYSNVLAVPLMPDCLAQASRAMNFTISRKWWKPMFLNLHLLFKGCPGVGANPGSFDFVTFLIPSLYLSGSPKSCFFCLSVSASNNVRSRKSSRKVPRKSSRYSPPPKKVPEKSSRKVQKKVPEKARKSSLEQRQLNLWHLGIYFGRKKFQPVHPSRSRNKLGKLMMPVKAIDCQSLSSVEPTDRKQKRAHQGDQIRFWKKSPKLLPNPFYVKMIA